RPARRATGWHARRRTQPLLSRNVPLRFDPHLLDLEAQLFVLAYLDLEEAQGQTRLLLDPTRRQQVHVGGLVVAVLEVRRLDPSLAQERPHAVIHLAETDAERARHIPLAHPGIRLEQAHELVVGLLVQHPTKPASSLRGATYPTGTRTVAC